MRLIDLFAGRMGWAKGFLAEGWTAMCIDLNYPTCEIPDGVEYVLRDVLTMSADDLRGFDFGVASSPCEQFSVHCMKHFHPNPPYPELGIRLFEHTRNILEQSGIPYVMENIRCAEKFVGRSVNHCGPFYMWWNAVPAVMPRELYKVKKGMDIGCGKMARELLGIGKPEDRAKLREYRKNYDIMWSSSKSAKRKEYTAHFAEIPLDLSRYIAQCATRVVEIGA